MNDSNNDYSIDTSTPEGAPEAAFMAFPDDAIPGIAGTMIQETRAAFGVESDIPGGLVLAASAALIGKGLAMEIQGERTTPNLFFIITGKSGCGKSKSFNTILKPLKSINAELAEAHSDRLPELKARKRRLEADAKKIESAKGKPPCIDPGARATEIQRELAQIETDMTAPRILAENATTESLGVLIKANREQLALMSADCGEVIQNLCGRYCDGKEDENLLLKGYSGDLCIVDRLKRDSLTINAPCLTMCLVGTPDVAGTLYGNARFMKGGFLARCLLIRSDSRMTRRDGSRRAVSDETMSAWDRLTRELFRFRESGEPQIVTCTPEAERVFDACHNAIVDREEAGELPEPLEPFASRVAEQAKRIALNLHAQKHSADAPNVILDESTARDGVRLAQWFFARQEAMLAASIDRNREGQADRLESKLRANGGRMTMRDLKRTGFDEASVRQIIGTNPFRFQIQVMKPEGGGRESEVVALV